MSFLPGWFPGGLAGRTVRVVRLGSFVDTFGVSASSVTWTDAAFGSADLRRRIALAIVARRASSTSAVTTISSCTIGGIAATINQIEMLIGDESLPHVGTLCLAYADVPTGTSGDIDFTMDPNVDILIAHAFAVYGSTGAPDLVTTPTRAQVQDVSQTTIKGAAVIGLAAIVSNTVITPSTSWSGLSGSSSDTTTEGAQRAQLVTAFESELTTPETHRNMVATATEMGIPVGHNAISAQFVP